MAKRRPPSSKPSASRGTADDAFTAGVLEFIAWARERTQLLVAAGVVVVLLAVGAVYWINQRAERMERAAIELEQVQQAVMFLPAQAAQSEVREFINRFEGTPHAVEARLLLAELHLEEGQPGPAIEVLEAVAPGFRSPLAVQATFLLAIAYEEADRWEDAANLFRELRDRAEFTFQKREAGEGVARAELAQGDTAAAVRAYESILEALEPGHPERPRYEMRLAELTAAGNL